MPGPERSRLCTERPMSEPLYALAIAVVILGLMRVMRIVLPR